MFLPASSYVNVTLDVKHSQHPKCIQSCSRPPPPPWPPVPAELLIIQVRVCVCVCLRFIITCGKNTGKPSRTQPLTYFILSKEGKK